MWMVVVTMSTWGTGSKSPVSTLPATRPAKWAMSTMKVAPTSAAISAMRAKSMRRG